MEVLQGLLITFQPFLNQIKKDDIVELILIDEGTTFDVQHPMHIHGYAPYVVAYERHAKDPKSVFGPNRKYQKWGRIFLRFEKILVYNWSTY